VREPKSGAASGENLASQIQVIAAAPDQEPILANLLELYAHDFSEFHDVELREDGRFGYKDLSLYWREAGRHPFLVRVNGSLAGFVLVKKGSEVSRRSDVWDVAEFFILRGYRRRGIGVRAAHEIWNGLPGPWEVRVLKANTAAQRFWARAISLFVGETIPPVRIEKEGTPWEVFFFESKQVT
jgi:predicted acetyltransferase